MASFNENASGSSTMKSVGTIMVSSPTGKLLLNLVGSIAQFEREVMLQRQREGISAAKAAGKYRGRAPTARSKSNEVFDLHDQGTAAGEIAKRLDISRASTYRILAGRT